MNEAGIADKPAVQPLYIDLIEDELATPQAIHLGFRSGVTYLVEHLKSIRSAGMNHVALNLRFNQANPENMMKRLATEELPEFH